MRVPYILYRRKSKVYHAAFWAADLGKYTGWKSTGAIRGQLGSRASHLSPTSKAGAVAIVKLWISQGGVKKDGDRFAGYLSGFWEPGSAYARGKQSRGRCLSADYLAGNRSAIRVHVLPFLESTGRSRILLRQVTPGLIEELIAHLQGSVSPRRINGILQAVSVPLGEAHRLGKISDNPAGPVEKLPEKRTEREPFTPNEVRSLFGLEWTDPRQLAINLLAATTGMRLGECRGLLHGDVHPDWIEIKGNWQDSEGMKAPKWGSSRVVPIPGRTAETLREIISLNPWGNTFVFWGSSKERPIGKRAVATRFNEATGDIGIREDERIRRGLTFHAWRHWYNSMLRGKIDDHALRKLTGHSSQVMTDRYTEITVEQREAVAMLAEGLIQT